MPRSASRFQLTILFYCLDLGILLFCGAYCVYVPFLSVFSSIGLRLLSPYLLSVNLSEVQNVVRFVTD